MSSLTSCALNLHEANAVTSFGDADFVGKDDPLHLRHGTTALASMSPGVTVTGDCLTGESTE
jgi:hypothetical protein